MQQWPDLLATASGLLHLAAALTNLIAVIIKHDRPLHEQQADKAEK
jgi:hypothetical protein